MIGGIEALSCGIAVAAALVYTCLLCRDGFWRAMGDKYDPRHGNGSRLGM